MSEMKATKKVVIIVALLVLGGLVVVSLSSEIQLSPAQESAAYLEVDRGGGGEQSNTAASIEFDALSAAQQDLFEDALERDRVEIPDETDSSVWYEYDYVRYQNTTYSITVIED